MITAALSTIILLLGVIILCLIIKTKKDKVRITQTISRLRKNEISSVADINLGLGLKEIENEVKSFYEKSVADIAHRKKLEQARAEFLGNVSHELKTPIFAIQGFIETLLDGAIEDENVNRVFLQKANQHVNNLNNLLSDLIDISMIESGQMLMSFRYFTLFPLLEEVVVELKPIAEKKGIALNLITFDSSLKVLADRGRIRTVMNNLVLNAIKYTEQGSIEICVSEKDNSVLIKVEDTGVGIKEADLGRIFERFYRVDQDRSRDYGGTGLGLSIVKHIIEAHGSKVLVESKFGEGSRFSFQLKM